MATLAEQIAATEAELEQATTAMVANFDRYAGTSSMRGKQHGIRTDAQIRRGAQLGKTVKRLERELTSLRTRADRPDPGPVDLDTLAPGCAIRTDVGWYRVVKVNRVTVKVEMPPGWDDLVKISKILEIRTEGVLAT